MTTNNSKRVLTKIGSKKIQVKPVPKVEPLFNVKKTMVKKDHKIVEEVKLSPRETRLTIGALTGLSKMP